MLLYLFCEGKTEDNLKQVKNELVFCLLKKNYKNSFKMFNLFDEDGNGTISIDELYNMMAFFIEIGQFSYNKKVSFLLLQALTVEPPTWPQSWPRSSRPETSQL